MTAQQQETVAVPAEAQAQEKSQTPPERHVENRTIVFPEQRILYVPVPKAGCTAVLWALATVAGLEEETFHGSLVREVSRSLTIHDLGRWPDEFVFANLTHDQRDEILAAEDWLRFTVVRHPFRRLWSAWQSKILLSEPQFTDKFSSQPWFPTSIDSAEGVLKMFRQFLTALEEDPDLVNADVHWAPQVVLTSYGRMPYGHVGRIEKLGDTVAKIRDHLHAVNGSTFPDLPKANLTPLPYVDELFDESDVDILARLFAEDLRQFDYGQPPQQARHGSCPPAWMDAVDAVVPALQVLRQRNERVGDLQRFFDRRRKQLNASLDAERRRSSRLEGRLRDLQQRFTATRKELNDMRSSASWRYTAPLRRLSELRRKVRGRLRK